MEKNERAMIELNWGPKEGGPRFEAVLVNGELKHLTGFGADGNVNIYCNDYKFLLALKDVLGELEMEAKTQKTRLGKNGGGHAQSPVMPSNS